MQERDFEGVLAAADKALALAPYDTFMRSRLAMVLVSPGFGLLKARVPIAGIRLALRSVW